MNKYVLSFFFLITCFTVYGQKKSIVNLISSKSSTGIRPNGKDIIKVYEGTFKQDFSTLTSDSAYFYPEDNAFDAFGHVIIDQGDTLHIYSDKLNYNGNTKIAILTDNVRMVDKDATLTTNHLTYNTATRIGTYTDGGKLVNRDNTLLSKNGYYFAFTRDSYFRYNVSLTTPDALVLTDTMRYNTGTRTSFFYGPTNIYSTKGEKDRDTLYTENGDYNTINEQAAFGKNNLYKSGTKSLKGDSLFYDKLKGYGRAVKHVTFTDREQKVTIKGNLGTYFKAEELTIVTQDPYIIMVTEEKDTTNTGPAAKADSISKKDKGLKNSAMNMASVIKNSAPVAAALTSAAKTGLQNQAGGPTKKNPPGTVAIKDMVVANVDTYSAKTKRFLAKKDSLLKKNSGKPVAAKKAGKGSKNNDGNKKESLVVSAAKAIKDTGKMKTDSIYMSADTIETWIPTYKDLKIYQEKQRLAHIRDTTSKPKKPKKKEEKDDPKTLTVTRAGLSIIDSAVFQRDFFGKPKPVYAKKKAVKPPGKKQLELDSLKKKQEADSVRMAKLAEPSDTARIRVIIAHHHAKLFKSDLQAKADSMFYSNSDSTIRCYVNPVIWTQGSQLTGDTIHLQMKHKKLDNLTMFPNAFIVNIEKDDSVNFNQVSGKRMRGFFKDDKLNRMLIDGNAESIYFSRDSGKTTVSGMQRSLSSRIRVYFKDNKATKLGFLTKPENKYTPIAKVKEDDKILKGFIWKPKERPVSKESIIPSYSAKKTETPKSSSNKQKTGAPPLKKLAGGPVVKDSIKKTDTVKVLVVKPVVRPPKVIIVY